MTGRHRDGVPAREIMRRAQWVRVLDEYDKAMRTMRDDLGLKIEVRRLQWPNDPIGELAPMCRSEVVPYDEQPLPPVTIDPRRGRTGEPPPYTYPEFWGDVVIGTGRPTG